LGSFLINDVRSADIDRVLKSIRNKHPATASNTLRDLKKIFRYAAKRDLTNNNPAANFDRSDAGGTPKRRNRFLSSDELADLFWHMRYTSTFGLVNELAVKLLLALCLRKMELLGAKWDEFDLKGGVWMLPGSKDGDSLAIPLAAPVIRWLQEARGLSGRSEYVFPVRRVSRRAKYPHVSPDTLNLALKKVEKGLDHFAPHDLRRTARTWLMYRNRWSLGIVTRIALLALLNELFDGILAPADP
jgi:integrase